MTVKNKISDAEALARFEEGLDVERAEVRDSRDTAAIRTDAQMRDVAQRLVDDAAIDARLHGVTWIEIAAALSVSPRQHARSTSTASRRRVGLLI